VVECSYSTIVLAALIAGATLGGPLGATLGSVITVLTEPHLGDVFPDSRTDYINRKKVTAVAIFRSPVGMGLGEICSKFGHLLTEEITDERFDTLFSNMADQLGRQV
jgi:hypothetical protein